MVIHKTFADFVLFLYVHMAYADGFFHPKEKDLILTKMGKHWPEEGVAELTKRLDLTEKEYLHQSADAVNLLIHDTFRHFHDVKFAHKYKVYTDLFDIVNADGTVDESETHALDKLKKIIDVGAEK
jgi:uncharacterized tellurite resistance protein B-like protein